MRKFTLIGWFLLTVSTLGSSTASAQPQTQSAILLSGGGARGDFEVGALKLLYEHGVQPRIICGTSVGSLNASKLAEGAGAISELEQIWRAIPGNYVIYEPSSGFRELTNKQPALADEITVAAAGFVLGVPGASEISLVKLVSDAVPTVSGLQLESGLFDFNPLRDNIIVPKLHPEKIKNSGIRLCLAAVSLEHGDAVHISETGTMTGKGYRLDLDTGDLKLFVRSPIQVDLVKAILASSSIPIIFEPIQMGQDDEHFVDGGTREVLPIDAFLEVVGNPAIMQPKVSNIYAILASPVGLYPWKLQFDPSLLNLGSANFEDKIQLLRVDKQTLEIMVDQIYEDNVARLQDYADRVGAKLSVINPLRDLHDPLTFDPQLIRINMDYGYNRAGDVVIGASKDVSAITDSLVQEDWALLQARPDSPEPEPIPIGSKVRVTAGRGPIGSDIRGLIQSAYEIWKKNPSFPSGQNEALSHVSEVAHLVYARTKAGFPTASLAWEYIKQFDWPYAYLTPTITLQPQPAKFDWGSVAVKSQIVDKAPLTITNAGPELLTVRISLVGNTAPFGVIGPAGQNLNNQQISVNPNTSTGLYATLDHSLSVGNYVGSISLQTNDPTNSVVQIPLHVNLIPSVPKIQWQPTNFDWGNHGLDTGNNIRNLTINNIGTETLTVHISLEGKTEPFGVASVGGQNLNNQQISVNPNASTVIQVSVDYSSSPANFVASLKLLTNDPANTTVQIPLHVKILPATGPPH
jgi:NTE family protein